MNKIDQIRIKEKMYHDNLYETTPLFEEGSWLHKPVSGVMQVLDYMKLSNELQILDLGCGVGRNSIPMAQQLNHHQSRVVCVDLLASAIKKLKEYASDYGVEHKIDPVHSTIEDYQIRENFFDYIISVSALEHLESQEHLFTKLTEIEKGVLNGGYVCFVLNTDSKEYDKDTHEELEAQFEIKLESQQGQEMLEHVFKQWQIKVNKRKKYRFLIDRDGKEVILKSNCISFLAKKEIILS